MRQINLSTFLNFGRPLYFGGGGGGGGMPASQVQAARWLTLGSQKKVADDNRRRVGGMDALQGNVLGSLRDQTKARTLGASATSRRPYTGEQ